MEKLGIEIAKDPKEEAKKLEKYAQSKVPACTHPPERIYKSKGVSYCRKCEKYLKIER